MDAYYRFLFKIFAIVHNFLQVMTLNISFDAFGHMHVVNRKTFI